MAKKTRKLASLPPTTPDVSNPGPPQVELPAWLGRVLARHHFPVDPLREIYLERSLEASIQMMEALPLNVLQELAAADSHILTLLRALQRPEVLPRLEAIEPLTSPYLRGLEAQMQLVKEAGNLMTSDDVAKLLNLTPQAVQHRRLKLKLLAIPQGERAYGYPACQFTHRGPIPGLERFLKSFEIQDPWMQLSFLLTPNTQLDGMQPLDLLRAGKVDPVIAAVEAFGNQVAN